MTRRCRRPSCAKLLDDETQPFCSDTCRDIDTVMARVPHSSGSVARMGRGADISEAMAWMDTRVKEAS